MALVRELTLLRRTVVAILLGPHGDPLLIPLAQARRLGGLGTRQRTTEERISKSTGGLTIPAHTMPYWCPPSDRLCPGRD